MSDSITNLQVTPASGPVLAATQVKVDSYQYVGGSQSRDAETSNFLSHSLVFRITLTQVGWGLRIIKVTKADRSSVWPLSSDKATSHWTFSQAQLVIALGKESWSPGRDASLGTEIIQVKGDSWEGELPDPGCHCNTLPVSSIFSKGPSQK